MRDVWEISVHMYWLIDETERERQRERQRQSERQRQRERQTDKDRGGHREMERDTCTSRIQRDKEIENITSLS